MRFTDRLNLRLEAISNLQQQLLALKPQIAIAAQAIYDQWQGEDDEELGTGGICDQIASEISGIITNNIEDIELDDWGHEGDDHAAVLVRRDGETYLVDIPPSVYETGGGYSWRKIPDVKFDPSDVQVIKI